MTFQEQHDERRQAYMANIITHEEFYTWLAESIGVTVFDIPVSLDRIRASTDPHLNNIPLHMWDRKDSVVRQKAVKAGMRSWSLSDTVCVLKNYARWKARQAQ